MVVVVGTDPLVVVGIGHRVVGGIVQRIVEVGTGLGFVDSSDNFDFDYIPECHF